MNEATDDVEREDLEDIYKRSHESITDVCCTHAWVSD